MIGGRLPIWRVLAGFWGEFAGVLPMIGGRLPIWRVLAGFWGGIGGLLLMIGGRRVLSWWVLSGVGVGSAGCCRS